MAKELYKMRISAPVGIRPIPDAEVEQLKKGRFGFIFGLSEEE